MSLRCWSTGLHIFVQVPPGTSPAPRASPGRPPSGEPHTEQTASGGVADAGSIQSRQLVAVLRMLVRYRAYVNTN